MVALLKLLRPPRPEKEPPAPTKTGRSGTYAVTLPRRAEPEEFDVEDFMHVCRGDEDHVLALAPEEPMMLRDDCGDRITPTDPIRG